jgi:hypothetical protein
MIIFAIVVIIGIILGVFVYNNTVQKEVVQLHVTPKEVEQPKIIPTTIQVTPEVIPTIIETKPEMVSVVEMPKVEVVPTKKPRKAAGRKKKK